MDTNELVGDEQNGFRRGRSCIDHLSSLTSLIETRNKLKLETFAAFVDFSKAYDRVDRQLLWGKLSQLGLSGKMLSALKAIYHDVQCSVRLNGVYTEWFQVTGGLKQGCLLSPLLFNLYVNDLIGEINSLEEGIEIGDERLNLLLYADDIVLVAPSEAGLQSMLTCLNTWCNKWRLKINVDKTKVVHFRVTMVTGTPQTGATFHCGDDVVDIVSQYRYLGLIVSEFMDYNIMSKAVAQSAGRALGLIIAKSKAYGGIPYECFTKLYNALVIPMFNYGADIWGTREFTQSCERHPQQGL